MTLDKLYTDVFKKLVNNIVLIDLLGGEKIYDYTPDESTAAPYIVIGDFVEQSGRLLNDTEREVSIRLHIWTSQYGRFQAIDIKNAIIDEFIKYNNTNEQEYFFVNFILEHEVLDWVHGVLMLKTYIQKENEN